MVCGSLILSASTTFTAGSRSTNSLPRPSTAYPGVTSKERSPRPRACTFIPPEATGTTPGVWRTRLCRRRFSKWYASAAFQSSSVVKNPSKKLIRLKLACSAIASSEPSAAPRETHPGAGCVKPSVPAREPELLQLLVLGGGHVLVPSDARIDADAPGLAQVEERHLFVGDLRLLEDQRVMRVGRLLRLDQRLHRAQALAGDLRLLVGQLDREALADEDGRRQHRVLADGAGAADHHAWVGPLALVDLRLHVREEAQRQLEAARRPAQSVQLGDALDDLAPLLLVPPLEERHGQPAGQPGQEARLRQPGVEELVQVFEALLDAAGQVRRDEQEPLQ